MTVFPLSPECASRIFFLFRVREEKDVPLFLDASRVSLSGKKSSFEESGRGDPLTDHEPWCREAF